MLKALRQRLLRELGEKPLGQGEGIIKIERARVIPQIAAASDGIKTSTELFASSRYYVVSALPGNLLLDPDFLDADNYGWVPNRSVNTAWHVLDLNTTGVLKPPNAQFPPPVRIVIAGAYVNCMRTNVLMGEQLVRHWVENG